MAFYRLNYLQNGHVFGGVDIHADDDAQAISAALNHLLDSPAELWTGSRKVKIFLPPTAESRGRDVS